MTDLTTFTDYSDNKKAFVLLPDFKPSKDVQIVPVHTPSMAKLLNVKQLEIIINDDKANKESPDTDNKEKV